MEQELVQEILRMQAGDFSNYERFFELSSVRIYEEIYAQVNDEDKATQILQDTYKKIYNEIHTLNEVNGFSRLQIPKSLL